MTIFLRLEREQLQETGAYYLNDDAIYVVISGNATFGDVSTEAQVRRFPE